MKENPEYSKNFYKIKEVSEFVGESPSTLRYWESEFPDRIVTIRNAGNIRYYTPDTIEKIKMIKYLIRDRGLKMEAAKVELQRYSGNVSKRLKILSTLEEIRSSLVLLQDALKKRR